MIALLRALLWLRWREARAALRGNRRRDPLEQVLGLTAGFVRALQAAAVVLVAGWFGLMGLAAGYFAATRSGREADKVWVLTGLAVAIATFATLASRAIGGPRAGHAASLQRMRLLPIDPRHLGALHVLSGLAEPWPLLVLPALMLLPVGVALGGRPAAALALLLAGLATSGVLLLLGTLAADVAALVMRNRRRAEAVALALAFSLILPGALMPFLIHSRPARPSSPPSVGPAEPRIAKGVAETVLTWATPPGLYAEVLRRATRGDSAVAPLAWLAAWWVPLAAMARMTFTRLAGEPDAEGGARGAGRGRQLEVLPFVGPGVSAVAMNHLWLARRSLMGRLDVMSTPLLCSAAVAAYAFVPGSLPQPPASLPVSFLLATGGVLLGVASVDNMLLNQFGVHGPGLARLFSSPLRAREVVRGQAVANAIQIVFAALPCALLPPLVLGGGTTALWVAAWLGLLATVLLALGFGALLSSLLCKAVDMGRLQADNPLPGLLAMAVLPALAAPPLYLAWLAGRGAGALPVALCAAWLVIACALALGLLEASAAVVERRRERLLLASEGR